MMMSAYGEEYLALSLAKIGQEEVKYHSGADVPSSIVTDRVLRPWFAGLDDGLTISFHG